MKRNNWIHRCPSNANEAPGGVEWRSQGKSVVNRVVHPRLHQEKRAITWAFSSKTGEGPLPPRPRSKGAAPPELDTLTLSGERSRDQRFLAAVHGSTHEEMKSQAWSLMKKLQRNEKLTWYTRGQRHEHRSRSKCTKMHRYYQWTWTRSSPPTQASGNCTAGLDCMGHPRHKQHPTELRCPHGPGWCPTSAPTAHHQAGDASPPEAATSTSIALRRGHEAMKLLAARIYKYGNLVLDNLPEIQKIWSFENITNDPLDIHATLLK
jgi:hypothetical protein